MPGSVHGRARARGRGRLPRWRDQATEQHTDRLLTSICPDSYAMVHRGVSVLHSFYDAVKGVIPWRTLHYGHPACTAWVSSSCSARHACQCYGYGYAWHASKCHMQKVGCTGWSQYVSTSRRRIRA